ncbi:hypothetical protein VOLCADRAFT_86120, partial [Volvox carteri f. nagariensis]
KGSELAALLLDVVNRHWSRMRPMHHAKAVLQLGLLTYGSRSDQRTAARRLAAQCTAAVLAAAGDGTGNNNNSSSSGGLAVGMDVLKVMLRGWAWVRKPPPELLGRLLEALVPGSSDAFEKEQQQQQEMVETAKAAAVRHGYGRLHTATLQDAAALVEPLAALDALKPPLLDVLVNVAVRRAGNEAPAAVAAAAIAYGRAGIVDPRVAQAFLNATATAHRRRGSGGAAAVAAAAVASQIAEALGLCAKAGWYEPRAYSAAADTIVAYGVGGLVLRQVWAVLRAFAGARHEQPLLTDALVAHAKALLVHVHVDALRSTAAAGEGGGDAGGDVSILPGAVGRRRRVDVDAAGAADVRAGGSGSNGADDGVNEVYDTYGAAPPRHGLDVRERHLTRELSMLAGLVHGFSTMQVYDRELYDRLAAGAGALLRQAGPAAALGESYPRALAAALTALLAGFAGVGFYPARLLDALSAQQHSWMRSVSVDQALSLTCALAALRNRDERLLERLDCAAAVFLENAVTGAAVAAGLLAAPATGGGGAAAAGTSFPDVSWLPAFLNAACRRLAYPGPRTVAALAAPVAVWEHGGAGGAVLRGLTKAEKKKKKKNKKDKEIQSGTEIEPRTSSSSSSPVDTISRLQLLVLVVMALGRSGSGGSGGSGAVPTAAAAAAASGGLFTPPWVCELMGGLACSGARLRHDEELDLAWLLARSIEQAVGADSAEDDAIAAAAAAAAAGDGHQRQRRRQRPLTAAQAAAALDDEAACHLFRAVIASQYRLSSGGGGGGGGRTAMAAGEGAEEQVEEEEEQDYIRDGAVEAQEWVYQDDGSFGGAGGGNSSGAGAPRGGLEAALHRALTPPVAAALLARAASAWHAAGLGTAAPQPPVSSATVAAAAAAAAAAAPPPPLPRRLRLRGGIDAAHSPLLSELLLSLGLPVFEQWETSDGFFRVARGVVLPGGRNVAVEVLPDTAFAAAAAACSTGHHLSRTAASGGSGGGSGAGGPCYPLVIGDAAFRARCLAARGWRLVALPEGEWAAAAVAGPAACMMLMRRRSGAL